MTEIYKKIIELKEQGTKSVLCTIVSTKGSSPLKAGAKMIVSEDGKYYGTVGGGSVERKTIEKAELILQSSVPSLIKIDLINDDGNSCGGTVDIFIEPISTNQKLYVFGAGHIGKALYNISKTLGFDITFIDNRENIFDGWPTCVSIKVISDFKKYLEQIEFDDTIFIAIITYDHNIDWEIISYCANKPWRYLGMMGSRRKIKTMANNLRNKGISDDIIDKINMPIGLDIDAETAEEIAISISAKLVMEKNLLLNEQKKKLKI